MASSIITKAAFLSMKNSSYVVESMVGSFLSRFSTSSVVKEPVVAAAAAVSHLLMHKHQFSPEAAKQVTSILSNQTDPQKADSMLSFLKERGFSNAQLERFLTTWPGFLSTSLENKVQPKLNILQDFGLSDTEIVEILSRDPSILHHGAGKITASLSILKNLLGSDGLANVLKTRSRLLHSDLQETLLPNIEFLKTCGVSTQQITQRLNATLKFLTISPEALKNAVHRVDEMGVKRTSRMFIYAVQVFCSLSTETLKLRFQTFKELGFSEDDIARICGITPFVFTVSEKKIEQVKVTLLDTGKYDMSCIVNYPHSLMFSVEKRFKPRLQILKYLEKENLISKWPGLAKLCTMTDMTFFQRYVEPYVKVDGETIIIKNDVNRNTKTESICCSTAEFFAAVASFIHTSGKLPEEKHGNVNDCGEKEKEEHKRKSDFVVIG